MFVFVAAVLLLLIATGLVFYFHRFLRRALAAFSVDLSSKTARVLLWCGAAVLGGCAFLVSTMPFLFVLYLFGFAVVCEALTGIGYLFTHQRFPRFYRTLRRVLVCGALPVLLSLGMLVGGAVNMAHVTPTYYTVETEKNIRAEGLRVALVADVHLGVSLDMEGVRAMCDAIAAEDVDLLVLCGDIVDESTDRTEIPALFAAFAQVKSTFGTFFVFGNHDRLRSGEEDLAAIVQDAGVRVLQDESLVLAPDLVLVGREDRSFRGDAPRLSIDTLLAETPSDAFRLVLDHQPSEYAENGRAGTDLLLSGHTHGGQLWPLDILQAVIPFNDAVYGETPLSGGGTAIVTSGVAGWGFPIKTAAPAEYVIIDIGRAE